MGQLATNYESVITSTITLEMARDHVRSILHAIIPDDLPYGARGTSLESITSELLRHESFATAIIKCPVCQHELQGEQDVLSTIVQIFQRRTLIASYPEG